ncbi:MAG: mycofactocin-coupled SDR family oxidoreductase [Ilumatobacteraceae bacterium]
MGRVDHKVAFITGAARGMGRSHAIRLAEEGADLILVDICGPIEDVRYPLSTSDDLDETAELARRHGGRVITAEADTRDREALRAVLDPAVAELGGLDVVVANAAVLIEGTWDSFSEDDVATTLDVNLIGTWNTCVVSIPHLLQRGGGSIICISSAAGLKGQPYLLPYTFSKFGVTGLAQGLANELAEHSIRVNSVHPTGVPTGMAGPLLHDLLAGNPKLAEIYQNALPVANVEPIDISNAVLFLASDESRYVTGLQFAVDAGTTNR